MIRARSQHGFSLVEVMVAILVLGVALSSLVHGINTALQSNKESEVQTIAAQLAAGQLESLRASGSIVESDLDKSDSFEGDLSIYTWHQTVVATKPEGLYEVTITIENTDSGEEIFELKSMIFDPPTAAEEEEADKNKTANPDQKRKRGAT